MTDYCYCSAVRCAVISAQLCLIIIIIIFYIMITIICITQGRTAANALKLVALTVKQKCLKSPTKWFKRDLR